MMSSQWPCMCVGKFTCCVVSNDARMSLNVVVQILELFKEISWMTWRAINANEMTRETGI